MSRLPPLLAVAAVVRRNGEILLVERGRPPAKGRWSVPGGHVEAGEGLEEALRREVLEETGIEIEVGELIGFVEREDSDHHYLILDFEASEVPGAGESEPRGGDDAAEARWVALSEVPRLSLVDGLGEFLSAHGVI